MSKNKYIALTATLLGSLLVGSGVLYAQQENGEPGGSMKKIFGFRPAVSIQSDNLFSTANDETKHRFLANQYVQATLRSEFLELGARFEDLMAPLPGRNKAEMGRGIPHLYASFKHRYFRATVGDFYDQFGSGIVFRSYEDRYLGIDNAVRGANLTIKPYDGITLKALAGQQRNNFDRPASIFHKERGYLWATDLELTPSAWSTAMQKNNLFLSLGASFVSKYEAKEDILLSREGKPYTLNLPTRVPALGTRLNFSVGGWALNGEYAYKASDPGALNNYIYKPGQVVMFSTSYSQSGLSILAQAKRSENFDYTSRRTNLGVHMRVNHMPPFTAQHTYTLAALYPYASQPQGEWAFQGEIRYKFPRKSFLGGKYGTAIKVGASHVRGLKKQPIEGLDPNDATALWGRDGHKTSFFGMGDLYYNDIHVEISKKLTKDFSFILTYMHQIYNQEIVEGHVDNELQATPHIWSNIFIADMSYRFSKKISLRGELQYLATRHGEGNWLFGLAELSVAPGWTFTLSDQYNAGTTKQHYYMAAASYSFGAQRIALSYGRTRAGMNCSGGICRWMPQTKGLFLSYNANF